MGDMKQTPALSEPGGRFTVVAHHRRSHGSLRHRHPGAGPRPGVGGLVGPQFAVGGRCRTFAGDGGALGLAWYDDQQRWPPAAHVTFRWGRLEVLTGLANALLLWMLAGVLEWDAVHIGNSRLPTPLHHGIRHGIVAD